MSPFRRKAVENALVAVLRELRDEVLTLKAVRPLVAERINGCSPAELAGAVQSLRYQGKLSWTALELSASMIETAGVAPSSPAEGAALAGAAPFNAQDTGWASGTAREASSASSSGDAMRDTVRAPQREGEPAAGAEPHAELPAAASTGEEPPAPEASGPDDHDDYPGEVNDAARPSPFARPGTIGGRHAAATRAGARPAPPPLHEPEIARLVREEAEEAGDRRRRATSTATVRQPLELRRFRLPDMSVVEAVTTIFAEEPHDLVVAINRKHPELWRRILLLGRATGQRPTQALYAVIEAGLAALEQSQKEVSDAA